MIFAWRPRRKTKARAVIFHVVEMPQLLLHTFHVEPSTFGLQMNLPEGTPMSRLRAHQIANQAQQDLRSDGFRTATVDYDLVPFIGNKVDLHLNIDAGERIRVKQVEFTGDTEFDSKDLRGTLRSLKIRRVTPPIPGIWNGWRLYPGYSPEGVQGDLALLRSYYISKGYFDATVKLDDVQVAQKAAHVSIQVQAGQLYHVRTWQVSGNGVMPKVVHPLNGLMRSQNFCSTLFVARREAEHDGILDFTVNLQVQPTEASTKEAPEADLTATIDRGSPFHVGRIEFTGNRHFSEAAVRSNFLLDEGDLLDEHLLRKSMARLNEANFFEPVNERTTMIHTDPKTGIADIDIRVMERKRGSWNLSGPVGPASVAGPLEASIRTRLPAWGSGLLEASTYTRLSHHVRLRPFLSSGARPSEDSLDSHRCPQPALYAGRRLEIGIHDHSATRLAIHGAGLRSVAAGASLASGIARRSRPGAGAARHRGHSQQPNHDVLRTAGAALFAGAERPCHGPAFCRVDGGTLDRFGHWRFAKRLASVD